MTDTPQIPPYAAARADYARERDADAQGALVTAVAQDSPAYDAGIERGMRGGNTICYVWAYMGIAEGEIEDAA